jgi:mRNA-degrading endonuclease toxin of MazEF toxin-antitoxin module
LFVAVARDCRFAGLLNLDDMLTVPRRRLKRLTGSCNADTSEELSQAIKAAFDGP